MEPFDPATRPGSPPEQQRVLSGFDEMKVEPPPVSKPRRVSVLMVMLFCSIGLFFLTYFVPYFAEKLQYSITRGQQRAEYEAAGDRLPATSLVALSEASQLISQRVGPSVVHIKTSRLRLTSQRGRPSGPSLKSQDDEMLGEGSGVIVDTGGYLLTNYHVVRGTERIEVHLSDGRTIDAKVVGVDADADLSVLKIDADKLIAAEWGDSDDLEEGSLVWAMGSPFGLEHSITFGILSAKNRHGLAGTTRQNFLQTDAAVNPGNSGGPLVDSRGKLVGINTAIVGQTFQGISFAIPSQVARDVYDRMRGKQPKSRGWLGVELAEITTNRQKELGLESRRGAYVVYVVRKPSPAAVAGVESGDVILSWDGHEVANHRMLTVLVSKTKVGSEVEIVVLRNGKELKLPVTVNERPLQYD